MSIYEGDAGLEAPAAPAAPSTQMAAASGGDGGLLAPDGGQPSGKVYTSRDVLAHFQSNEITLATAPRVLQVTLALVLFCMVLPLFAEDDYDLDFFLFWPLWILLWGLTLCGIVSHLAQQIITGRKAKTTCGGAELRPWAGAFLFFFIADTLFGIMVSQYNEWGWFAMFFANFMEAIVFVAVIHAGAMFTLPSLGYPIKLTHQERRCGSCVWTVFLVVILGLITILMLKDTFVEDTNYWVIRGRSNAKATNNENPFVCASTDDQHEVRCCSDSFITGYTQSRKCKLDKKPWAESIFKQRGCVENANFYDAKEVCEEDGARLCTKEELQADCTAGTGCMHDADLIWTGEECSGDSFEKELKKAAHIVEKTDSGFHHMSSNTVRCKRPPQGQSTCLDSMAKLSSPNNQGVLLPSSVTAGGMAKDQAWCHPNCNKLHVEVFGLAMNFTEAECFCHDFGGHLLSIHSQGDYNALAKAAELSGVREAVFVGGFQTSTKSWVWSDGSGPVDTTANWLHVRIDQFGGVSDHLAYCGSACSATHGYGVGGVCGKTKACCDDGKGGEAGCVGIHDWGRSDSGIKLNVACALPGRAGGGNLPGGPNGPNGR